MNSAAQREAQLFDYNPQEKSIGRSLKSWFLSPLDYSSRTQRKPFWIVQAFLFVINVLALVPLVYYSTIPSSGAHFDKIMLVSWSIFFTVNILLLFVNIPLTARRVRDTGVSVFISLFLIVPIGGYIAVMIVCALPSNIKDHSS